MAAPLAAGMLEFELRHEGHDLHALHGVRLRPGTGDAGDERNERRVAAGGDPIHAELLDPVLLHAMPRIWALIAIRTAHRGRRCILRIPAKLTGSSGDVRLRISTRYVGPG